MFHPRLVPHLRELFLTPLAGAALAALGPLLRRLPAGRMLNRVACGSLAFGLAMLAERELRGEDVPGANDNASGCGVAAQLAVECAANPLPHTRVDLLLTGCEEVGMLGAQDYVRGEGDRVRDTVFINFDSVGGDVPVRFVLEEGMVLPHAATPRLVALVEEIARERPELGLEPAEDTGALTTDATVALAHGCEAITFLARDRTIPNYHWPTDTYENIAPLTVRGPWKQGAPCLPRSTAKG